MAASAAVVRRWAAWCALAEAVGMTAAAAAAKASHSWWGEPSTAGAVTGSLLLVVAAGLVEGTALGLAQSRLLRSSGWAVRHRWFLAATVLVAGLGWAAASAPAALAGPGGGGSEPPQLLVVLGGAGLGLVLGPLLGGAQATALSAAARRSWVRANLIAWPAAMAVIFLGATTPGPDWAPASVVLAGTLTGAAAGAVLGALLALAARPPRLGA